MLVEPGEDVVDPRITRMINPADWLTGADDVDELLSRTQLLVTHVNELTADGWVQAGSFELTGVFFYDSRYSSR